MCGVACPSSVIAVGCTCHAPRLVVSILTNRNETVSVLADSPATPVVTRRDRDDAVDPESAGIAKWRDENSSQTFGAALPLSLPIP
jgi:hypothetical protein